MPEKAPALNVVLSEETRRFFQGLANGPSPRESISNQTVRRLVDALDPPSELRAREREEGERRVSRIRYFLALHGFRHVETLNVDFMWKFCRWVTRWTKSEFLAATPRQLFAYVGDRNKFVPPDAGYHTSSQVRPDVLEHLPLARAAHLDEVLAVREDTRFSILAPSHPRGQHVLARAAKNSAEVKADRDDADRTRVLNKTWDEGGIAEVQKYARRVARMIRVESIDKGYQGNVDIDIKDLQQDAWLAVLEDARPLSEIHIETRMLDRLKDSAAKYRHRQYNIGQSFLLKTGEDRESAHDRLTGLEQGRYQKVNGSRRRCHVPDPPVPLDTAQLGEFQKGVLELLWYGLNQTEIANILPCDQSKVSRAIKALCKRFPEISGFVEEATDAA